MKSNRPEKARVSVLLGALWLTVPVELVGTLSAAMICCAKGVAAATCAGVGTVAMRVPPRPRMLFCS